MRQGRGDYDERCEGCRRLCRENEYHMTLDGVYLCDLCFEGATPATAEELAAFDGPEEVW